MEELTLHRITHRENLFINDMIGLYEKSFPENERRTTDDLINIIEEKEQMHACAILLNKKFCGIFNFWTFNIKSLSSMSRDYICPEKYQECWIRDEQKNIKIAYIEHFATKEELRNQKIGSKVLTKMLTDKISDTWLLEAEHATDELTTRRVNYYIRHGFYIANKNYVQPSYSQDKCQTLPLLLMCNNKNASSETIKIAEEEIKKQVYNCI